MKLAVNYSPQSLQLLQTGQVRFDLVKLPAWPEVAERVAGRHPCYIHFPLKIGSGLGVLDNETKAPVQWEKYEPLKSLTQTRLINLHVSLSSKHYPGVPRNSTARKHLATAVEKATQDALEAVQRFGPKTVMIENEHDGQGRGLLINLLPELYHRIIENTGCGFLLDISHARIAARALGMEERKYIQALPLQHLREVHITGIHWFGEQYIEKVKTAGMDEQFVSRLAHHWMDHMSMTQNDWRFTAWALECIHKKLWGQPWVAAFEYGGIGPFFGTFTDPGILIKQIPRLYELVYAL